MTTAQCIGGSIGPTLCSISFAWSISKTSSSTGVPLVNQTFVFNLLALIRLLVLVLVWNVLTVESLTEVVGDPAAPRALESPGTELDDSMENGTSTDLESSSEGGSDTSDPLGPRLGANGQPRDFV